eukprot:PhF_6_TR22511/c0_g1_i1/m.31930
MDFDNDDAETSSLPSPPVSLSPPDPNHSSGGGGVQIPISQLSEVNTQQLMQLLSLACDEIRALRERIDILESSPSIVMTSSATNNKVDPNLVMLQRQNEYLRQDYKKLAHSHKNIHQRLQESIVETHIAVSRAGELQATVHKLVKENTKLRERSKEKTLSHSPPPPPQHVLQQQLQPPSNDATKRTMLRRIKRALAPPISAEQSATLVQGMFRELSETFLASGMVLSVEKESGTNKYIAIVGGKQKQLHLAVHSGQLVVQVGAGYEDFIQYVERHVLWRKV